MEKSTQAAIGAAVFGGISLLFWSAFGLATFAVFNGGNPNLVLVAGFFGLFASGSTFAFIYGARLALRAE